MLKKLIICAIALCGLSVYLFFDYVNKPGDYDQPVEFLIPRGANSYGVAEKLAQNGVIASPLIFRIMGRLNGLDKKLKAGEYLFAPQMSLVEVMEQIASGDIIYRKVTLPEGLTVAQMMEILNNNPYLSGEIENIPVEGSLLPETYSFMRGDSRQSVIEQAKKAMDNMLARVWENRDASVPLKNPQELLILASIVEKETGIPEERGLVASVFVNRLKKGMLLQTDPTVIYALTGGKKDLGRLLTRKDLRVDNPYNTYKYRGLPPGPICNPGRESLLAAANPELTDYIFFVASGNGGHNFARNLKEHNRNVREWKKQK